MPPLGLNGNDNPGYQHRQSGHGHHGKATGMNGGGSHMNGNMQPMMPNGFPRGGLHHQQQHMNESMQPMMPNGYREGGLYQPQYHSPTYPSPTMQRNPQQRQDMNGMQSNGVGPRPWNHGVTPPIRRNRRPYVNRRQHPDKKRKEKRKEDVPVPDGALDAIPYRSQLTPFVFKLYCLVNELRHRHLVSWTSDGQAFKVMDPEKFASDVCPEYFKHDKYSSFVRQLNKYRFRKDSDTEQVFRNPDFRVGSPASLMNICVGRQKSPQRRSESLEETSVEEIDDNGGNQYGYDYRNQVNDAGQGIRGAWAGATTRMENGSLILPSREELEDGGVSRIRHENEELRNEVARMSVILAQMQAESLRRDEERRVRDARQAMLEREIRDLKEEIAKLSKRK